MSFSQKLYFCLKSSNLTCYFLIFYISSNLRSNFCYYSRLERFKMILRISNGWSNRNIDDDKCAKMPIFSYIIKLNKCICLLFMQFGIYSQFGFPLFIYVTKINWTIPYFIILISNRANFAVRGPGSLSTFPFAFSCIARFLILFTRLSVCSSVCLSVYLSVSQSISLCLSVSLSLCSSVCVSVSLSPFFSLSFSLPFLSISFSLSLCGSRIPL